VKGKDSMAGDWIAIRCDLATEPEVIAIADATGLDEFAVVGRLHRLWSWANRHTTDGNARSVTFSWIDRYLQHDGFAQAMRSAGWLEMSTEGVTIPHFDRFNSQSGKQRLLTAKRVSEHKRKGNAQGNAQGNAKVTLDALPKEQKRTEENRTKKGEAPLPPVELPPSIRTDAMQAAVDDWLAYKSERRESYKPTGLKNFLGQVSNAVASHGEAAIIARFRKAMAANYRGWDFADSPPRGSPSTGKTGFNHTPQTTETNPHVGI
jgi:hypothetical protein